jgi:hypothetical protein
MISYLFEVAGDGGNKLLIDDARKSKNVCLQFFIIVHKVKAGGADKLTKYYLLC